MKKNLALVASFAIAIALTLQFGLSNVYAASHKIDCSQVMTELQGGKKVAEVAKDMKISKSSVYRCRTAAKKEKAAANMASPAAKVSPAAMGTPAAAAPAAY